MERKIEAIIKYFNKVIKYRKYCMEIVKRLGIEDMIGFCYFSLYLSARAVSRDILCALKDLENGGYLSVTTRKIDCTILSPIGEITIKPVIISDIKIFAQESSKLNAELDKIMEENKL